MAASMAVGGSPRGMKATSDVFVTCQEEPSPTGAIDMVKVLVLNATGELAHVGEGEAVEDSHWQAVLGPDVTGAL
jgi:hypothetical protein